MSKGSNLPVRATMCATCPFRAGSPYAYLVPDLAASSMTEASRICHSTGSNGLHKRTGKPRHLCRGARDLQLSVMTARGVIAAPTDAAWNDARVAIGMQPILTRDP